MPSPVSGAALLRATLVASLLAAPLVRAQTAPQPGRPAAATTAQARADALTANMAQALVLTPAQVEKVRAINLNSVRNVEAARQRLTGQSAKLQAYIAEVGAARVELLKDVLTPMQFNRYQQKREEKMGIPQQQGYQGNAAPGLPSGRGEE